MASVENESEILLGNKQLLAVFAVVTILLATAFTGGYMLGKSSAEKKPGTPDSNQSAAASAETSGGPITQKITPEDPQSAKNDPSPVPSTPAPETVSPPKADTKHSVEPDASERVLGQRSAAGGDPMPGESYVQVMAVSRKDAEATAEVLRQHEFKARIAPAPGNSTVFRVLVGPGKDAADLRNTEDELRRIGYTKCFVQHY